MKIQNLIQELQQYPEGTQVSVCVAGCGERASYNLQIFSVSELATDPVGTLHISIVAADLVTPKMKASE